MLILLKVRELVVQINNFRDVVFCALDSLIVCQHCSGHNYYYLIWIEVSENCVTKWIVVRYKHSAKWLMYVSSVREPCMYLHRSECHTTSPQKYFVVVEVVTVMMVVGNVEHRQYSSRKYNGFVREKVWNYFWLKI